MGVVPNKLDWVVPVVVALNPVVVAVVVVGCEPKPPNVPRFANGDDVELAGCPNIEGVDEVVDGLVVCPKLKGCWAVVVVAPGPKPVNTGLDDVAEKRPPVD